jgi:hypothetical protein
MKSNLYKIVVFSFVFTLAATTHIYGAKIQGVYFDDSYIADEKKLKLRGTGLLRYLKIIKAYVGAFYLDENCPIDEALTDRAKRIEVQYFQAIKGEDFGPATSKSIAKNVDPETFERLRPQIEYHNSLYVDVKPGDRYSLTYIPGKGTELALNGEPRGVIEGAEFAAALFAIWIGQEPIDRSFKNQILGLA